MKKFLLLICIFACVGFCLCGCSKTKNVTDINMTLELQYGSRTGKYSGVVIDNIPNGNGKFTTKNEAGDSWSYEGEFVDGHFNGQGKCVWDDGQVEEGTYLNDMMNGLGKRSNNDIPIYDGNWKNGLYEGNGKLYSSDGKNYYEGNFVNNIPDEKDLKSKCLNIPYEDLARKPESYIMDPLKATGKVIQVIENNDGSVDYRIADNGDLDSVYFIMYERKDGEPRILVNDIIEIYGLYYGLKSYTSVLGGNITIPCIGVNYLTITQ